MKALDVPAFEEALKNGATLIDLRSSTEFLNGFIPQAVFLGEGEKRLKNSQHLMKDEKKILFVLGNDQSSIDKFVSQANFRNVIGYLKGGIEAWKNAGKTLDMLIEIEADEFLMDLPHDKKLEVIDVRSEDNFHTAHVKGARNKPLQALADLAELVDIDDDKNLYIHCGGGHSCIVAASLLKREGYEKVRLIAGGFSAISEIPGMPIVEGKTPLK